MDTACNLNSARPQPRNGFRLLPGFVLGVVISIFSGWAAAFEWPQATAEEVGIDPAALAELNLQARRGSYGQLKSLLVLRHGKLVYEAYFNGYRKDDVLPLYSVTKSWASALIGIAIERGELEGVNQSLADVFGSYASIFNNAPGKRDITVRDLLTMRHGLAWDEWSTHFTDPANPVNQMTRAPDWWQFVLSRPQTALPDTVFRYSTGTANLLGGLIWTQTGQSAIDYAKTHLFGPLDIDQYYIEVDLSDGPKGSGIKTFQAGLTPTGHGLWLKASDLAKIGQLYLDGGVWNGERVLSSAWVEESWLQYSDQSTDPGVFSGTSGYGYQWWSYRINGPDGPLRVQMAWGYGDQFILIVPRLDLLLVSNANNGQYQGPDIRQALSELLVPAVAPDFDPVNDGALTGSWHAPALKNQGFMLEVVPSSGQVLINWMSYDPDTGEQQWMLAVGQLHARRALLQFLRPVNGEFAGDKPADLLDWGEVELLFTSCTTATLDFSSPLAGVDGRIELQRLTPNTYCRDD